MVVIPNGMDLTAFRPDEAARDSVRKELNSSSDVVIIGVVGRFDPNKDHQNFIQAAAILCREGINAHFLFCGDDITWENTRLASWFDGTGMENIAICSVTEMICLV